MAAQSGRTMLGDSTPRPCTVCAPQQSSVSQEGLLQSQRAQSLLLHRATQTSVSIVRTYAVFLEASVPFTSGFPAIWSARLQTLLKDPFW